MLATTDPDRLGSSFWFETKDWTTKTFPRHLFYRAENGRAPVPQHTKQMIALRDPGDEGGKHEGWMLVGSHNPTQAAWGKLQFPKGKSQPQRTLFPLRESHTIMHRLISNRWRNVRWQQWSATTGN